MVKQLPMAIFNYYSFIVNYNHILIYRIEIQLTKTTFILNDSRGKFKGRLDK